MRVLAAPDDFKGTLSAPDAARAMATGWRAAAPADTVEEVPVSDGGTGFVDVLAGATGGRLVPVRVTGPLGQPVPAAVLVAGPVAYVESAAAAGLQHVPPDRRDPVVTTTRGVGELIRLAAGLAPTVVVGLGGSATCDGGAGMLQALGWRLTDAGGAELAAGGGALAGLHRVQPGPALPARLVAAADVDAPLLGPHGAARGFAPQKGATPAQVALLERALARLVAVTGAEALAAQPGAGAAGGLGFAVALLGAQWRPGFELVAEAADLPGRVAAVDLVLTGEGAFDWQSLRGKAVSGVAALAMAAGRPCLVLAGRVQVGRRAAAAAGVSGCFVLDELPAAAPADAADRLAALAALVARRWSPECATIETASVECGGVDRR